MSVRGILPLYLSPTLRLFWYHEREIEYTYTEIIDISAILWNWTAEIINHVKKYISTWNALLYLNRFNGYLALKTIYKHSRVEYHYHLSIQMNNK